MFVCWGNICRSPMAERVAQSYAERDGLTGVEFTSAATSSEELGEPMDQRAARTLSRHGYAADDHVAHRIDRAELDQADLVIAMEGLHVERLHRLDPDAEIALLTDFDPAAQPGSGVPDPWYGSESGFLDTLSAIEAAMPGIIDRARSLAAARAAQ
ncbi:low molecular weight protein-tyrosine-phosphatase [Microlunatus sp. GCM10028923]|uniref:low molecular weight protein-tyrosine-phosphatase n=1 Tax=Microlunatus sp. GCM10028923 TaxID=3273400 RepID=UPI00361124E3